jgi:hypothetical protein
MRIESFIIAAAAIAITLVSCQLGARDMTSSLEEILKPQPSTPVKTPKNTPTKMEKERRMLVLLHSCTIDQVVQVQIPVCNALQKEINKIADEAEKDFVKAGI